MSGNEKKPLKVLIDTNVAITFLTKREDPFIKEAAEIMFLCSEKRLTGYLAMHSLSIIWYLGRKAGEKTGREMLEAICGLLTVVGATQEEIIKAVRDWDFKDFEDCLQDKCAKEAGCDYIVTANKKDFAKSEVPAVSPAELLRLVKYE